MKNGMFCFGCVIVYSEIHLLKGLEEQTEQIFEYKNGIYTNKV